MTQPPAPSDGSAYASRPEYVEPVSRFNPVVAVLGVVAAVLGVVSVTALDWYRNDGHLTSGGSSHFSDVHKLVDSLRNAQGVSTHISPAYFQWLGYVLVAVAVVGALVGAVAMSAAVRTLTAVVAIAGLGLTLWAIQLFTEDGGSRISFSGDSGSNIGYLDWLKHTSFGTWTMMLAFVLCFVAALVRPRRQRSRGY